MGGSIWGVLVDINATTRHKDPYTPSTFSKKFFPSNFSLEVKGEVKQKSTTETTYQVRPSRP